MESLNFELKDVPLFRGSASISSGSLIFRCFQDAESVNRCDKGIDFLRAYKGKGPPRRADPLDTRRRVVKGPFKLEDVQTVI